MASDASREISGTRMFDAPRDLVFRMFTEMEHVVRWWGPRGFLITVHEMSVRPGGVWRFVMHGPDGRDYVNQNVFREVTAPSRIVYDHASGPPHRAVIELAERRGKTEVRWTLTFADAALRDRVAEEFGAVEGLQQTMARLGEELDGEEELVLTRTFAAPRQQVFDAWTTPEALQRWWGPRGFTLPTCLIDFRAGGALRFVMRGPDGADYGFGGTYREVIPPQRIVFTSVIDADPEHEMLTTVTFAEDDGKTTVMLRQTAPRAEGPRKGQRQGWTETLDRLQQAVE
jgi:uncharacterized protein YndB with AHSA1/START domain